MDCSVYMHVESSWNLLSAVNPSVEHYALNFGLDVGRPLELKTVMLDLFRIRYFRKKSMLSTCAGLEMASISGFHSRSSLATASVSAIIIV
jgi:hypothetical protein